MSPLGFMKSQVYHGEILLGELDIVPVDESSFQFPNGEIRIHRFSPNSERCPPLPVLHSISSSSVRCKLESSSPVEQPHLINLHASCFYELKTAIVLNGDEEIHLVAMPSKLKKFPCFWCYSVPAGLYTSCLGMLNMRCLSIVFDLDETLIVANTMKSFEYRMDTLRSWIAREFDVVRANGMAAELKRCTEDRLLLKQYIESDSVLDNGKVLKAQFEDVPSDNSEPIVRPVIRLPEKGVVLTRINPEIRDTSVLVRLRPAWEDLRSYLIAKEGRKRFEVYVCTMAERDYALEMWRLLDPEGHLIGHKQLPGRVVCVKSGSKKSLLNVFHNGICHSNMAMVIDDRQKVWEDTDQPRVHVVPAFSPYFAPQAETANAVPVLCVARNVACNVRGGFFKEFEENYIKRISEIFFEDEVLNLDLPAVPDVSNYLMPEIYEEGGFQQNGTTNAPIPDGVADAEVEHRLNQPEKRNTLPSQGGWLVDEDTSKRNLNNRVSVFSRPTQVKGDEAASGQDWRRPHLGATTHSSDAANQQSFTSNSLPASLSIGVLQEIGRRCSSKVEFRPVMSISRDLQFSFEVLFTGEKIGFGMGKTRKDAQQQAAENALRSLAGKYVAHATPSPGAVEKDYDKLSAVKENGFLWDTSTPELDNTRLSNDGLPKDRASEV